MTDRVNKKKTMAPRTVVCILSLVCTAATLTLPSNQASAKDNRHRANQYKRTNLVSDLPGVAVLQDTNLVNAWGISFSAGSPFWVSANGTGLAILYAVTNDDMGLPHVIKQGLEVTIPGEGTPTGQLFNTTTDFNGDIFIFASEDGIISGWPGPPSTTAEVLVARPSAVYKGITLVTHGGTPMLLAANFRERTVDAYDGNLTLVQYADPHTPAGYAPFNVQAIGGLVFVTFAKQDAAKHDDVAGPGHGLIDVFDPQTGAFHRFVTGSDAGGKLTTIDSPWGLAVSPASFGRHADQLLVGNFGSGTIMAFEASGKLQGILKRANGRPLQIDGLWGLAFGNGARAGVPDTLYFSAGPNSENHGLFGSIEPVNDRDNDRD